MHGKTILITGGTAGIGLAAAQSLASRKHRLILVGRDEARGRNAITSLSPVQNGPYRFIGADLSLMAGVRAVVPELEAQLLELSPGAVQTLWPTSDHFLQRANPNAITAAIIDIITDQTSPD